MTEITFLDYLVFFIFVGGVALFGCSFYFKSRKSSAAFTKAEGSLPSWVVGMSIFATFVSSISFLGLPGDAFKGNWSPFVFSLSIPFATILAAKIFIPLYRGVNSVSAYHYLETKFGYWARCYASICYLLTQVCRIGSILLLLALPINKMFADPCTSQYSRRIVPVAIYAIWIKNTEAILHTATSSGPEMMKIPGKQLIGLFIVSIVWISKVFYGEIILQANLKLRHYLIFNISLSAMFSKIRRSVFMGESMQTDSMTGGSEFFHCRHSFRSYFPTHKKTRMSVIFFP